MIVLALEQTPSRLLPRTYDAGRIDFIDGESVDLHAPGGGRRLQEAALSALRKRKTDKGRILVVLDSVDELVEEGVDVAYALVRNVLKELRGFPGSSLHSRRDVSSHASVQDLDLSRSTTRPSPPRLPLRPRCQPLSSPPSYPLRLPPQRCT